MTTQNFELLKKSAVTQIAQDLANQTQGQLNQWALDKSFTEIGDFTAGFTITARQQIALFNGEWYRWDGALPKVVAPGSTPSGTGGIAQGAWLSVGDAALRNALAAPGSTVPVGGVGAGEIANKITNLPHKSFLDFVSDSKKAAYALRLGTLDYTAELQAAADFSNANKVAIHFPAGWAPHTGITIKKDTVFVGGGENHVVLENTTTNTKSISIEYVPESFDWQNYWALIGMRITARTKGTDESQVGFDIDTGRHGYLSRLRIDNHYVNFRERATWSCYFEFITLSNGYFNFLVDDGPSTVGAPNTYVGFNNRFGAYNIDIRTRGLNSTVFSGGCSESASIAGLRISGSVNRSISFVGVNFEANAMDYISGDNAVSDSGPANVAFIACQFTNRTGIKPVSMQLFRGQNLLLECCNFINYEQVAELSPNFGTFNLIGNGGISNFADSTNANTKIPLSGVIQGNRLGWSQMSGAGFVYSQEATNNKILRSRRHTESHERFSVGSDGKLFYHPFNSATHDTEFGRVAANVMGTGVDDGFRTGIFPTASYPSASAFGQGTCIFDSDKNRPMYSRGSEWRDALGTVYTNQTISGLTVSAGTVIGYDVVASMVNLGAMIEVSFSEPLGGVTLFAEVSEPGKITVWFTNMTGSTKAYNGTLYIAIRRNN